MSGQTNGHSSQLKIPPHNLEAEKGVIGSVLLIIESIDDLSDLSQDHFYENKHRTLWKAIADLHSNGVRAIDSITLAEELDGRQQLAEIGGVEYLVEVMSAVPHGAHARYYADIVIDRWVERSLIYACTEVLNECYNRGATDTHELLESAEKKILGLSTHAAKKTVVAIKDLMVDVYSDLQTRLKTKRAVGSPTGFEDLDRMIVGLCPKHLDVIAARPSMGKTALACKIALTFAIRGEPVLFVSVEMGKLEIAERLACIHGSLNANDLKTGVISGNSIEQQMAQDSLMKAFSEVQELPIFIDDEGSPTVSHIAANARRLKRKHGLGLLVIDYLQLIKPDDPRDIREQQVAKQSRALKSLAKELEVPIIVLAQLNRGVENRDDKRPRLADLRESGAVEQDADMVMFLSRPEFYDPEERPGQADLTVAKNRGGKTGTVTLGWRPESTQFTDLSEQEYAGADAAAKAFRGRRDFD